MLLVLATACGSGSGDSADDQVGATVPGATAEAPPEPTVSATEGTSPPATGADAEPTPTDPTAAVPEALQFTAPLVGGGTFDGAAAAGKPTVFWFWAPT